MKTLLLSFVAAASLAGLAHAQPARVDPDADHDGKVTLQEYQQANAARTDRMFQRMDTDKDGKISKAEMDAMMQGMGDANGGGGGGLRGMGPAMMERLDTDHDGAVSRAEMDAQVAARFARADANHDGWLSPEELANTRPQMQRGGQ